MPHSPLTCSNPIALPPSVPLVKRQSSSTFTDWDLLRYAYLKIGLQADGSAAPGSIFEAHAKLHREACSGADDGIHRSGGPFLIWHRAFLYFHERALNKVLLAAGKINADRIRLPYWHWDSLSADDIPLPPQYAAGGVIPAPTRNYQAESSGIAGHAALGNMLGIADFFEAQDNIGYVHAEIHESFPASSMGDLMNSAFDPIFYSHHSQVDRLFEAWKLMHNTAPPPIEGNAMFIAADGARACYRLSDFLDPAKLGYGFDKYPQVPTHHLLSQKIVLNVSGLQNPAPHYWAFIAEHKPETGSTLALKDALGTALPGQGMHHTHEPVPEGTQVAFLLRDEIPKQVWAATVTTAHKVQRVDQVEHFSIEPNKPNVGRSSRKLKASSTTNSVA